jgi:hypothetical protein
LRPEEEEALKAARPRLHLAVALTFVSAALVAVPPAGGAAPEGALDARAWELVSPLDKNGGEVSLPGAEGAGAFQAAAGGGAIAYASAASFGDPTGAAPVSQYLGTRGVGGWSTQNLTPPLLSGTYAGGAYQLFSSDLQRAILSNGWRCRDGSDECEAENPPLAADAPAGYRNLYLRVGGTYTPLITTANAPALALPPDKFHLTLRSADPDLRHVVISTCAALTAGSSEVPDGEGGCDPAGPNFYEWSDGELAEVVPSDWEAEFDPGAEVQGVIGASADRSYVYFVNSSGLWLWQEGANTKIAASADASNYPAATGTARVSADGTRLAFLSSASLTGYPNAGKTEVYLYEAPADRLLCVSCNARGAVPKGPSTIPAARAAGEGAPPLYKPRALSENGRRLFFDSADNLVSVDTDFAPDVYEWEAQGTGGCAKAAGCLGLVSGGRVGASSFLDASADGTDAFFLTATSLLPADPGYLDVYDARAGGGFPEPTPPIPCFGDACQGPAPAPEDPAPATDLLLGRGNPPLPKPKHRKRHKHKKHKRHHRQRARSQRMRLGPEGVQEGGGQGRRKTGEGSAHVPA